MKNIKRQEFCAQKNDLFQIKWNTMESEWGCGYILFLCWDTGGGNGWNIQWNTNHLMFHVSEWIKLWGFREGEVWLPWKMLSCDKSVKTKVVIEWGRRKESLSGTMWLGWWRTCKWRVGGGMPIYIYLSPDWTETWNLWYPSLKQCLVILILSHYLWYVPLSANNHPWLVLFQMDATVTTKAASIIKFQLKCQGCILFHAVPHNSMTAGSNTFNVNFCLLTLSDLGVNWG